MDLNFGGGSACQQQQQQQQQQSQPTASTRQQKSRVLLEVRKNQQQLASPSNGSPITTMTTTSIQLANHQSNLSHNNTSNNIIDNGGHKKATSNQKTHSSTDEKQQSSRLLSKLAELRHRIGYRNGGANASQQKEQRAATCGGAGHRANNGSERSANHEPQVFVAASSTLLSNYDVNLDVNSHYKSQSQSQNQSENVYSRVDDFSHNNNNNRSARSTSDFSSGFVSESSEMLNVNETTAATSNENESPREFRSKLIDDLEKLLVSFGGQSAEAETRVSPSTPPPITISATKTRDIRPEVVGSANHRQASRFSPPIAGCSGNSNRATPIVQDTTLMRGHELDYSTLCRDEFSSFIAIEQQISSTKAQQQVAASRNKSPVASQRRQRSAASSTPSQTRAFSGGPMLVGVHESSDGRSIDTAESLDRSQSDNDDDDNDDSDSSSPSPTSSPSLPIEGHEQGEEDEDELAVELSMSSDDLDDEEQRQVDYRVHHQASDSVSVSPEVEDYSHSRHRDLRARCGSPLIEMMDQSDESLRKSRLFQDYEGNKCDLDQFQLPGEGFTVIGGGGQREIRKPEGKMIYGADSLGGSPTDARVGEVKSESEGDEEAEESYHYKPEIRVDDGLSKMLDVYLRRMESLLKLVDGDKSVSMDEAFGGRTEEEEKTTADCNQSGDQINVRPEFRTEIEFVPLKRPNKTPKVIQEMTIEEEIDAMDSPLSSSDMSESKLQQVATNVVTADFYTNMMAAPHLTPKLDWADIFRDFESGLNVNSSSEPTGCQINLGDLRDSLIERLVGEPEQQIRANDQQRLANLKRIISNHLSEFIHNYKLYQEQFKSNTSFATDWHSNWYFAYSKREHDDSSLVSGSLHPSASKRFKNNHNDDEMGGEQRGRWSSSSSSSAKLAGQQDEHRQQVDLIKYSTLVLGRCKPIRLASIICRNNSELQATEQSSVALDALYEAEDLETLEQVNELCSLSSRGVRLPDVCHMLVNDLDGDEELDADQTKRRRPPLLVNYETSLTSAPPEIATNRQFTAYGYRFDLLKLAPSRRFQMARGFNSAKQMDTDQLIGERKFHKLKLAILKRFVEMIEQRAHRQLIREPNSSRDQVKFVIPLKNVELVNRLPIIQFCAKCSGSLPILVRWFRHDKASSCWQEIGDVSSAANMSKKVKIRRSDDSGRELLASWPINMQANYDFEYQTKWSSWFRFRRHQDEILFEIRPATSQSQAPMASAMLVEGEDHDFDRNYKCVIQNYCSIEERKFSLSLRKRADPKVELKRRAKELEDDRRLKVKEDKRKAILRTWSQRTLHRPQPKTDDRLREKELELEEQQVAQITTSSLSRVQLLQQPSGAATRASQLTVGHLSSSVAAREVDRFGRDFPYHPENLLKRLQENKYSSVSISTTRCKLISRSSRDSAQNYVAQEDDSCGESREIGFEAVAHESAEVCQDDGREMINAPQRMVLAAAAAQQTACRESEFRQSFEQVDEDFGCSGERRELAGEIREAEDSNRDHKQQQQQQQQQQVASESFRGCSGETHTRASESTSGRSGGLPRKVDDWHSCRSPAASRDQQQQVASSSSSSNGQQQHNQLKPNQTGGHQEEPLKPPVVPRQEEPNFKPTPPRVRPRQTPPNGSPLEISQANQQAVAQSQEPPRRGKPPTANNLQVESLTATTAATKVNGTVSEHPTETSAASTSGNRVPRASVKSLISRFSSSAA